MQDYQLILSLTFFLIYFLFKLGVGPFYTWTIEVYNACPTNTLLPVSIVPKLVYFPILFFLLYFNFIEFYKFWTTFLLVIGFTSIFIGSFGIFGTVKLKEIYAWSSIIHTSNIIIMFSTFSKHTLTFIAFYLLTYCLVSIGFILVLITIKNKNTGQLIKTTHELSGLSFTNQGLYILVIILFASNAGFTPFISFFMKFSLLSLISFNYGVLLIIGVGLLNIIGSIVYLKILRNVISYNLDLFQLRKSSNHFNTLETNLSYSVSWFFNFLCLIIIFSFFFYNGFLNYFSFYHKPLFINEDLLNYYLILPETINDSIYINNLIEQTTPVMYFLPETVISTEIPTAAAIAATDPTDPDSLSKILKELLLNNYKIKEEWVKAITNSVLLHDIKPSSEIIVPEYLKDITLDKFNSREEWLWAVLNSIRKDEAFLASLAIPEPINTATIDDFNTEEEWVQAVLNSIYEDEIFFAQLAVPEYLYDITPDKFNTIEEWLWAILTSIYEDETLGKDLIMPEYLKNITPDKFSTKEEWIIATVKKIIEHDIIDPKTGIPNFIFDMTIDKFNTPEEWVTALMNAIVSFKYPLDISC